MRTGRITAFGAALGVALVRYGMWEARQYRLSEYEVPVLPSGAKPVKILQVSDFHLNPANSTLIRFVESLSNDSYDLILATGDFLGEPESVHPCVRMLNTLKSTRGKFFVLGSSDYYAPTFKNYMDYFLKKRRHGTTKNPTGTLKEGLEAAGWTDLRNRTVCLELAETSTQLTGLDDPYLRRDDRSALVRQHERGLAICVVHDPAPYLDAFRAGYDLVVAGHTHGGQVRLPFVGAVVTNSTLPTRLARGLSKVGRGWLFVTPGLGAAKFAPFRFLCPPEASVLNLVPRTKAVETRPNSANESLPPRDATLP